MNNMMRIMRMTDKELLDTIYIKLESYATNLNNTYNDLVQNDLDEELEWSANEIMNEKIVVYDLMYKIPKLEEKIELLTKYKRAFEILKDNFFIDLIERQDDWKLGFEPINPIEEQPRFSRLPKEEAELLEELMNGEED